MQSIGEVCPEFTKYLDYRKEYYKSLLETVEKDGSRDWYSPYKDSESDKTVLESKDITERFKTDKIEKIAEKMFNSDAALRSDFMSLQRQYGVILTAENTFRKRHVTVPRLLAHSVLSKLHIAAGREDDLVRRDAENLIAVGKKQLEERQA